MNAATTARTNNQSAIVALLAAASAKPAAQSPRDDSFAQVLSGANDPKAGNGLFADPREAAAKRPAPSPPEQQQQAANSANKPAARQTRTDAEIRPSASSPGASQSGHKGESESANSATPTSESITTGAELPQIPSTPPLASLVAPPSTRSHSRTLDPATKSDFSPTPASAASETPRTDASQVADDQITPEAAQTKRAPTDPLRLIQNAQSKPLVAEVVRDSKPAASTDNASSEVSDIAIGNDPAIHGAREPKQNGSNQPQGFAFNQPGLTVPQNPLQIASGAAAFTVGQIASNSTSNTATTSNGAPRLDQVQPPRLPGGRTPEVPISLKLTARPTNQHPGLSQAEADVAATQISRGLTTALRNNSGQLTLWMNPEALGKIRVQLAVDGGTISARFEATSEATKQLLSQNVDVLRSALEARGLKVTNLEVVSIPDWSVKPSQDQNGQPGTKTPQDSGGSPQQNGGQGFSQSGGQQHQDLNGAKFDWLREPDATPLNSTATPALADTMIHGRTDAQLITLNARLELDAVA